MSVDSGTTNLSLSSSRQVWSRNTRDLLKNYKDFVTKNPLLANEIEVCLKWTSYLVAGRFSRSPVVTEFIHSASKLLNLVNDSILRKAAGISIHQNVIVERLQTFLTVIDHAEVFAEVAAGRIAGQRGRWLIVILLELIKFITRILLLLKYEQKLQVDPPVSPLNRQKDVVAEDKKTEPSDVEVTFTLKSSKRIIRKLEGTPPLVSRSWKLPKRSDLPPPISSPNLEGKFLSAEILHLCRPLMHLASMGVFGKLSWKPFFVAFAIDVTSLHILRQREEVSRSEKAEMSRRTLSLLVYLLRSPFYDRYSKGPLNHLLLKIADNFYGSGIILRPLIDYLPEWQRIYFYNWS